MKNIATRSVVISCLALTLGGCTSPKVSVECSRGETGELEIHLVKNDRVNGFLSLRVWQKDAPSHLWDVNLGYFPTNQLVYGEIPLRTPRHFMRQIVPPPPQTPDLPEVGRPFYIAVSFQYDSTWPPSACAADALFKFRLKPDGDIETLGTIWHPWQMQTYSEKATEPKRKPQPAPGHVR